jgi:hypothetical protein
MVAGEMNDMKMIDRGDRWSIVVDKANVIRAWFDWAVTLAIGPLPDGGFEVRIEQPFVLLDAHGGESLLVPDGDPVNLASVLRFLRRPVARAEAFKDGHLELELADGTLLSVPSAEDLEPWGITGSGGARIVSVPGGSISVWGGEAT